MKAVYILCALIGVISAKPALIQQLFGNQQYRQPQQQQASSFPQVLRFDFNNAGFGGFRFNVDTSDQFHHDATGAIVDPGTPDEGQAVHGHYSYIGDNGKNYSVEYFADKDGFRAAGEHLPQASNLTKVGPLGIPSGAIASLAGGGLG